MSQTPETSGTPEGSSTPQPANSTSTRLRPIPRKGHQKSRAGCQVCKRRRVKCDESRPACGPCHRLNLECVYSHPPGPSPPSAAATAAAATPSNRVPVRGRVRRDRTATPAPAPSVPVSLSTTPGLSLSDLRFFHNFLFNAYPALPVKAQHVWQDMAQLSHQYDFLAHAMLALGASHLGVLGAGGSYDSEALAHRVKALRSLNGYWAVLEGPGDQSRDAAFAALISLMFQSAYMEDGMVDFLWMIRGCYVVGVHNAIDSVFRTIMRDPYVARVSELLDSKTTAAPHALDRAIHGAFCDSLDRLRPLCTTTLEVEYTEQMKVIVASASTDPVEGLKRHSFIYDRMSLVSQAEFVQFIDPGRPVSRLVVLHLLALDLVLDHKQLECEGAASSSSSNSSSSAAAPDGPPGRQNARIRWIKAIVCDLPDEYRPYAAWISRFVGAVSLSFEREDQVWRPFLLHEGAVTLSGTDFLVN